MNKTPGSTAAINAIRMFALLVLVASALATPEPAHALGIVVNSNADDTLANLDANNSTCDLREAIFNANADSNATYPDCGPGSGTDSITFAADYTITLVSQLPDITSQLTITGNGSALTIIEANGAPNTATYRVFYVGSGANLTLDSVTVRHGKCTAGCSGAADIGGGIYNNGGTLTLIDTAVDRNIANYAGGVFFNGGTGTVRGSTFDQNTALTNGGAIYKGDGALVIANSTFSANTATYGGGVTEYSSTNTYITNSTFSANTATTMGGALYVGSGTVFLRNNILANSPSGYDCLNIGTIGADVNNLILNNAPGLQACGTPAVISDPLLGPLAYNGGPTKTFALPPGSPAIGAGDATTCGNAVGSPDYGAGGLDQNALSRPQGSACEIGAFEVLQPFTVTYRSLGAQDGWLLESSETSGKAGTANSIDTTFYLGDNSAKKQYRGILSFDTSPLPDNAVITGVTLKIKRTGLVGGDPFLSLGNVIVDIKTGSWSGNPALQLTDFYAAGSKNFAASITNTPVSNWYTRTFGPSSLTYINRAGQTQIRLRFATDDNNDLLANYLKFASGDAIITSRPQLIVTYYVP